MGSETVEWVLLQQWLFTINIIKIENAFKVRAND